MKIKSLNSRQLFSRFEKSFSGLKRSTQQEKMAHPLASDNQPSLYFALARKPSALTIQSSREKNGLDHTPQNSKQKEMFKYYCPICMMYYKSRLSETCLYS